MSVNFKSEDTVVTCQLDINILKLLTLKKMLLDSKLILWDSIKEIDFNFDEYLIQFANLQDRSIIENMFDRSYSSPNVKNIALSTTLLGDSITGIIGDEGDKTHNGGDTGKNTTKLTHSNGMKSEKKPLILAENKSIINSKLISGKLYDKILIDWYSMKLPLEKMGKNSLDTLRRSLRVVIERLKLETSLIDIELEKYKYYIPQELLHYIIVNANKYKLNEKKVSILTQLVSEKKSVTSMQTYENIKIHSESIEKFTKTTLDKFDGIAGRTKYNYSRIIEKIIKILYSIDDVEFDYRVSEIRDLNLGKKFKRAVLGSMEFLSEDKQKILSVAASIDDDD